MRSTTVGCAAIALAFSGVCLAQETFWEVGGSVGYGFMRNASIDTPLGSTTTGVDNGVAAGAVIGENIYQHFEGELRYTYRQDDASIQFAGQKASVSGDSHLIHYDVLFHPTTKESRIRPFLAAGAGIRLFRATGEENASEFSEFAVLNKSDEVKPLISVGGGVKARLTGHTVIRVDFREYISPFPENLISTAPGIKIHGWLFDSVPLAGLSFVF
jgi:hypothetical protein